MVIMHTAYLELHNHTNLPYAKSPYFNRNLLGLPARGIPQVSI